MPPEATPAPSAADFNQAFSASASSGIRRVWELAEPGLPAEVEPFSFVSAGLLRHVLQASGLGPAQTLTDLACGRGGPGLWLARETEASLVGVDFSPVAVEQAAELASRYHGRQATDEEVAAAMRQEPSDDLTPPGGLLLYARYGYREVRPFSHGPYSDHWFEKQLPFGTGKGRPPVI